MAIGATAVWEVMTGASDLNGGGYMSDAGTTDYSQQAAAQLTVADGATAGIGNTTLTSVTGGFTAQMVGNIVHLYSGVNLTDGWYEITAYTDTNTVTLDRAPDDGVGAMSSADTKVGGAFATPGGLAAALSTLSSLDGMRAYIKAATYTLSNSVDNTSGGPYDATGFTDGSANLFVEGYDSSRGDRTGTRPVIDAGAQTGIIIWTSSSNANMENVTANIEVDGNSGAGNTGFQANSSRPQPFIDCVATDCPLKGFDLLIALSCEAYGCGNGFGASVYVHYSYAEGCTIGFQLTSIRVASHCIANGCGMGFDIYQGAQVVSCIAYDSTTYGFRWGSAYSFAADCVSYGNGGYGFGNGSGVGFLENCFAGSNTSGNVESGLTRFGTVTNLSADPFTNKATGDFRPNNTAGGGALLRAVGSNLPTPVPTTDHDVGAAQHEDAGGGGGAPGNMSGGLQ